MKKNNSIIIILLFLAVAGGLGYVFSDRLKQLFFRPRQTNLQQGVSQEDLISPDASPESAADADGTSPAVEVVATDLDIPWEIAFLPNGEMLVTERPGRLLKIGQDRQVISEIEGVQHVGEGGLLGLVLHPDFEENQWLYLYLTTESGSGLINRVERYRFNNDQLSERVVILDQIPGASYHDGGRLAFGPEGYLWITTGDAGQEDLAQDTNSLAGKILRLNDDGSVPADNPFNNPVYSYGHRNPQGLAWDDQGRLWATEHGPSGAQSGFDELNLIEVGNNYGWPEIRGDETQAGMVSPVIQSGADETWAPAGAIYDRGSVFFVGLRGSSLYEAQLNGTEVTNLIAHFQQEYGRLRAVVIGPEGDYYLSTSNTDGRGQTRAGDDKIIRLDPQLFN